MNILFVSCDASRTGVPQVLLFLLQNIRKSFDNIVFDVLLQEGGGCLGDFEEISNVYFLQKKKPLIKRFRKTILHHDIEYDYDFSIFRRKKYDLVYSNGIESMLLVHHIHKYIPAPILLHVHESEFALDSFDIPSADISLCSHFIAAGNMVKEALIKKYKIDEKKIDVLIPFSNIIEKLIKNPPQKKKQDLFTIGSSGSMGWTKGTDLLPIIINRMAEKYPQIPLRFMHVGTIVPKDSRMLKHDMARIGKQHQLVTTGSVPMPLEYYGQFDVFLLLSREDSFPLAAIENALMGTPVICMKDGSGIVEEFQKADCAIVVPYLSIESICDAIFALWSNQELNKALGERGQRFFRGLFDEKSYTQTVIDIIRKTISICPIVNM